MASSANDGRRARPSFSGASLPSLTSARDWTPGKRGLDGKEANQKITSVYQALDEKMSTYLGEPLLPNWMTFGKFASHEAGTQILRLEELLKASRRFDVEAMGDSLFDFLRHISQIGKQGLAMFKLSGTPKTFLSDSQLMRNTLVFGNTAVYADVAQAYSIFLQAETAQRSGVDALRAAGYGRGARDPQGLLLQAFEAYQRAHQQRLTLSPSERKALVNRANMLIVSHEQMDVVQGSQVFGNRRVARLMAGLSRGMTVSDARGTFPLLPNGGNWADFATRMGYVDAPVGTPEALAIRDAHGVEHHYVMNPDARQRAGTISEYFASALNARDATLMIHTTPGPLEAHPHSGFLSQLRRSYDALKSALA